MTETQIEPCEELNLLPTFKSTPTQPSTSHYTTSCLQKAGRSPVVSWDGGLQVPEATEELSASVWIFGTALKSWDPIAFHSPRRVNFQPSLSGI